MKTIMVLMDSVNRRFLDCYGSTQGVKTPNIDRLAEKSIIFENHYTGSSPCMPARRDLMTGRLNFLDRPWGAIEAYDHTLQKILKDNGVFASIYTDHFHYTEIGGENYMNNFSRWIFERGQEHDSVNFRPCKTGIPASTYKDKFSYCDQYDATRKKLKEAADYATPRTFTKANEFLEENHEADNFFLWVESFDPHEPFDIPQKYLDMYENEYDGKELFWPEYMDASNYTEAEIKHFRNRYRAILTMTDDYLGQIFDTMDKYNMWEDTMVILTTDHGYMLGEHGYMAKNYMPDYNEIFNIPLVVYHPEAKVKKVTGLTQNIDVFPTILEYHNISLDNCKNKLHGKSLLPLILGEKDKTRDEIIFGQYGKTVNITDGKYTYMRRAEREDNQPLNVYTSMPTILNQFIGYDIIAEKEFDRITLDKLSWTKFPVYKIPADIVNWTNESQVFTSRNKHIKNNKLFDNINDYAQLNEIQDEKLEKIYIEKLKKCMEEHDSPVEQFERLGI